MLEILAEHVESRYVLRSVLENSLFRFFGSPWPRVPYSVMISLLVIFR